ncbi:hypothetical protein, partial [Klebsiella pneumoniae]|uniref:hypothetical protein n=1 Tax=Klebsiella pneumoniae TaxID=573 RepID=UPI003013F527
ASERNNELDGSVTQHVSYNDSGKSFHSHTFASRPLVPPGFASTVLEKNSGLVNLSHTHEKEIGNNELEERILHAKAKPVQNGILDNQEER